MKTAAVILDKFGQAAGATRNSFYAELARFVDVVWVYALRWTEQDFDMEALQSHLGDDVDIAWILSINGYAVEGEGLRLAERHSCPFFAWYWDSPYLLHTKSLPEDVELLHACEDFTDHPAFHGRSRFLPFSGVAADPAGGAPDPHKGLCFLGTCWSATGTSVRLAGGVVDAETKEQVVGAELFQSIEDRSFFDRKWTTPNGFEIKNRTVWNYYSTLKRLRYLSSITHLDLNIYGRADWFVHGLPLFPDLAPCLNLRTVHGTEEMRALFNEHRVSLNIFHHQNRGGGPNFRTLESATHRIPMLSEYNRVCAELFPHGEAALYFNNTDEMIDGAKELEANGGLRAALTGNAADILMQGHLHKHRCTTLFDWAGRNAKRAELGHGTVVVLRHSEDGLARERPSEGVAQRPEPLLTSPDRKIAAFKSDNDLRAKRNRSQVAERLQRLQARNKALQDKIKHIRVKKTRIEQENRALRRRNVFMSKLFNRPLHKKLTKIRRRLAVLKRT